MLLFVAGGHYVSSAQAVADTVHGAADSSKLAAATTAPVDTVKTIARTKQFQPRPKKAGLYSAIVPGLGQAYNRNYWKVPVVYAGIGVAAYFYIKNQTNYQSYKKAYISRINNPNSKDEYTGKYDNTQLLQYQNDAKKYLDMTVLFSGIGYALQVIDAITSAHLKNFDISRDISMHAFPTVFPGGAGIAVVVNIN